MALDVGRASIHMEVGAPAAAGTPGGGTPREGAAALLAGMDTRALRELLRPLVLDILAEELERLRRQHG